MSKIEKRVIINGSLERLFTYVPEIEQSSEIWPGLLEVGEVQRLPHGGIMARWIYKMAGVLFEELGERSEPLVDQLRGLFDQPLRLPEFMPVVSDQVDSEPTPALDRPQGLLYENGYGGFTPGGREYVIYLSPGQLTPLPWMRAATLVLDSPTGPMQTISQQAVRLRDSGSDALHVVIKPGSGLQLSLNLQMHGKQIEVQAILDRGDFHLLSRHWPELQQQLEARGIRLAPLAVNDQAAGNSAENFRQSNERATRDDAAPISDIDKFTAAGSPAMRPISPGARILRGWESWA